MHHVSLLQTMGADQITKDFRYGWMRNGGHDQGIVSSLHSVGHAGLVERSGNSRQRLSRNAKVKCGERRLGE